MPKYALAFEEHLDPIKKRGKVVLDGAIPEGASIQVIRKTPIETEFLAQALKPLPTEALEHALDKICYIQQEIEGHLCDCRGVDWPPPGVVGPPGEGEPPGGIDTPECQPYSCDSFVQSAIDAGMQVTLFPEVNNGLPAFDNTGFLQSSAGQINTDCRILDSWIGQPITSTFFNTYSYYDPGSDSPDLCESGGYGLRISSNHLSTTDSAARLRFSPDNSGFVGFLYGSIDSMPSGEIIFLRTREVTHYGSKDPGDPIGNYTGSVTAHINVDSLNVVRGGVQGITPLVTNPAWTSNSMVHVEITFGEPYIDAVPDGYYGTIYYIMVDVTSKFYLNGVGATFVQSQQVNASYSVEPTIVSTDDIVSAAFLGTRGHLRGMAFGADMPDEQDAYRWFQQNHGDYQPPEYCTFSGAEI